MGRPNELAAEEVLEARTDDLLAVVQVLGGR